MATIPAELVERLVTHCRAVLPNEGCGYLVGEAAGNVVDFAPITNAAASPTRFVLDPAEQLAEERTIEEAGRHVIGIAHSHPEGEASLSATDLADAANYDPFEVFLHAVVSPRSGEVRCFRIVDGTAVAAD